MKIIPGIVVLLTANIFFVYSLSAQQKVLPSPIQDDISIKVKQISELTQTLKNIIEYNEQLSRKVQDLENELKKMQQEKGVLTENYETLKMKKEALADSLKAEGAAKERYSEEIKNIEQKMQELTTTNEQYLAKMKNLEQELAKANQKREESLQNPVRLPQLSPRGKNVEMESLDLLSKIDVLTKGDERLRIESSKLHYQMGKMYIQRKEYKKAADEFNEALELDPGNFQIHFDLAVLSGDYLKDYASALKHYQRFLQLNPQADNALAVAEKMKEMKVLSDQQQNQ